MKPKMRAIITAVALSIIGGACKGPAGSQGPRGPNGIQAQQTMAGPINSNDFPVLVGIINPSTDVRVFLIDSTGTKTPLPFYAPALGINIYFLINGQTVTIYNALTVGAVSYEIVAINEAGSMAARKILRA